MIYISAVQTLILAIALGVSAKSALADLQSDCRQEAVDYGVEPESAEQYIQGCVESRGGGWSSPEEATAEPEAQTSQDDAQQ